MKAEATLASGHAEEAAALAERLAMRSVVTMRIPDVVSYNQPFLKDVLARAYWKKGDLDRAAAEYRKLLTVDPSRTGPLPDVPSLPLPARPRARGERRPGRGPRRLEKFLDGWKDADPSHPKLADARRRLAAR